MKFLSMLEAMIVRGLVENDESCWSIKFEHAINTGNNSKAKFWQEQLNKIFSESSPIRIQIAQFNPIVGDIKLNAQKMLDLSIEANNAGAHLIIFPELALTGYPPEDLLFRDGFINQVKHEITNFCNLAPSDISILFGNHDGQHTKQTLLCISNEVKGTLQTKEFKSIFIIKLVFFVLLYFLSVQLKHI